MTMQATPIESKRETATSWLVCEECDEVRMRTPSGTVCPNGHGRLHQRASAGQIRTAHRHKWALDLPEATKVKGGYEINGKIYEKAPVNIVEHAKYYVPTGYRCLDGVVAVVYGKTVRINKFTEVKKQERIQSS